ncbi:MAG: hypothetical protein ABI599_07480 [Flavobacteriales bacterium]
MKLIVLRQANDSFGRSLRHLASVYSRTYLNALRRKVKAELVWLKENSGGGQFEDQLAHLNNGYRRLVVAPFKIVYRIEGNTVVVTDIFDARRDPKEMKG